MFFFCSFSPPLPTKQKVVYIYNNKFCFLIVEALLVHSFPSPEGMARTSNKRY